MISTLNLTGQSANVQLPVQLKQTDEHFRDPSFFCHLFLKAKEQYGFAFPSACKIVLCHSLPVFKHSHESDGMYVVVVNGIEAKKKLAPGVALVDFYTII